MKPMKIMGVILISLLLLIVPATAITIIPLHTSTPQYKYTVSSTFVPPSIIQPVNESILKNAKVTLFFTPLYRVAGAGFALFDRYDNVIFTSVTYTVRSPIAYDPYTNTFATTLPFKILNIKTGKIYSYNPGVDNCIVFTTTPEGKIKILQNLPISTVSSVLSSTIYYKGILVVDSDTYHIYIYKELVYPNGSVNFKLIKCWNTTELGNYIHNRYGVKILPCRFVDNIWFTPSGHLVLAGHLSELTHSIPSNISGVEAYTPDRYNNNTAANDISNDIIVLNSQGDVISYIPADKTRVVDIDVLAYGENESIYAFSNYWVNRVYINGHTVVGSPVMKYDTWPIYMSAISTCDGRYIFAYKNIQQSYGYTRRMVLEVWQGDSVVQVVNNSSDILNLPSVGIGTTQPRTSQALTSIGSLEILPFPTGMVLYNMKTKHYRLIGFNHEAYGRMAAVSDDGRYCVMGDTVYIIGYTLNIPAIMYEGDVYIYHNATDVLLNSPVIYSIPSSTGKYGYIMRALSGKIIIGNLYSKKTFINVISNPTIGTGKLWDMYKKGLIKTYQYTNISGNGQVTDQNIEEGDYANGTPYPRIIYYVRNHILRPWAPYIAVGEVGSAIDIQIPVNNKIPISDMQSFLLNYSLAYGTIVPQYVENKALGFMFSECGVGVGTAIAGRLLWNAFLKFAPNNAVDQLATGSDTVIYGAGETANMVLSKAVPVVGLALVADGVAGYFLNMNAMHSTQLQTYLMVAPEFKDNLGNRYVAVTLLLPANANVKKWEEYTRDILEKEGITRYVISIKTLGTNKQEFQSLIAHMSRKELERIIDIKAAYTELMAKYGEALSKLKLDKIHLYIATLTSGNVNLWSWVTGGYKFQVITAVYCAGIHAQAIIPARIYTNPQEICNILNPIYINSIPVNLTPSSKGAVATFTLPQKSQYVVVQVGKPYYAAMTAMIHSQLIAPLHKKNGLYETNFTYSWKYCFNESKIMFMGMPYKMVDAYETVYTTHGNEPVNMTPYMSFITAIRDNSSPNHERYYYGTVTKRDLRLIDPHNAGMMEKGKKFWIQYWYRPPSVVKGDVKIAVMFNGTTVSNTLPRHARVILYSTRTQTVYGNLQVIVGYEDMKTHQFHTVDSKTFNFALNVYKNSSTYKEWDIQKYVGEAIHQYALGKVGFIKLIGTITKAKYDIVKTNDMQSLIYYPPSTLTKIKPAVLTVKTINALTNTPVTGAKVLFDNTSYTTNSVGIVNISTTTGYHTITVNATGFHPRKTGVMVYTNMTYTVGLFPAGDYIIFPPNGTNTTPWWISPNGTYGTGTPPNAPPLPTNNTTGWTKYPIIYDPTNRTYYLPIETVVQYLDGMPVAGATVKYINTSSSTLIRTVPTDGTGYSVTYFPNNYNLTINVTDPSLNYTSQKTVFVNHPLIIPFTIPQNSTYFEPEVAINNVSVWIHLGLGEAPNGLNMSPVYHSVDCWFYTNVPQDISFEVYFVNTKTNQTVASRTFTVHLHKGFQKVRVFVPVKIKDFTTCQVFCKITKYQQDTNPYNNYAVGNVVTFRPWVDIYPTVVWYPVKQKTPYGLLPGDLVKVCIAVHVPKHVHLSNIHVKYAIHSDIVGKHKMKTLQERTLNVNSVGQLSTLWYNYTIQLPWTDKLTVNTSVSNEYDLAPGNNNFSIVIPLSPDAQCLAVHVQSLAVSGGSVVPVRVLIRSNYIGIQGTITIIDTTAKNATIGLAGFNVTAPEQTVVVPVKVPSIKKIEEQHTWLIYVTEMNDVYRKDNTQTITVTVWGIPSWIVLGAIFIVVLIVLLLIKHLLTIKPPRTGKYFRRLDINDKKGGKYFRRVK